jgi:NADPH2:quinone reductase
MKAIRIHEQGPPDVMKLEEVPDPKPGDEQIVIEIKAVGINPVEAYIRSGKYPIRGPLPYTPGADAGGIVRQVSSKVTTFRPGDRVYTAGSVTGTYAQFALCNAAQVHPLPEKVTFQQGAAIGVPYATAWRALFIRGNAIAGETLLVHGASGGAGTAAVQIAAAAGLTVIGTAGTDKGLKLVLDQGAKHALNHKSEGYLNKIMDLTSGNGVNLILEMLANLNLNKDLGLLAQRGRVVVIGNRGPTEIDARQTMTKDAAILGMSLFNATPAELWTIHSAIGAGLSNGTLRPIISREMPLAQAPQAHEAVMESGAYGKIVLIP